MTQIDFYTNVSDRIATACRIAAKAHSLGNRMLILCPDAESAARVDHLLWTAPATGFIPHCAPTDPLAGVTPIIVDAGEHEPLGDEVLLNLRTQWPPFFGRFQRLVEIVSTDEDDKKSGRERWKFYHDRGYEIRIHDLGNTQKNPNG